MTEPSLLSWHPEAVNAWASIGAAIGTVATAAFLTMDRLRPEPHHIVGHTGVGRTPSNTVVVALVCNSERDEPFVIRHLAASRGTQIAQAPHHSGQQRAQMPVDQIAWAGSLDVRRTVSRGGGDATIQLFWRIDPRRRGRFEPRDPKPSIEIRGELVYRRRGRFRHSVWVADIPPERAKPAV